MDVVALLERSLSDTRAIVKAVRKTSLTEPTPCAKWTVRQLTNHMLGSIGTLARLGSGEPIDPAEFDPQAMADADRFDGTPLRAFDEVAERAVRTWQRDGALDGVFQTPLGPTPGQIVATIQLLESAVHGWDLGRALDRPVGIDDEIATVLLAFAKQAVTDATRGATFGPAIAVRRGASTGAKLLAHLGRQA